MDKLETEIGRSKIDDFKAKFDRATPFSSDLMFKTDIMKQSEELINHYERRGALKHFDSIRLDKEIFTTRRADINGLSIVEMSYHDLKNCPNEYEERRVIEIRKRSLFSYERVYQGVARLVGEQAKRFTAFHEPGKWEIRLEELHSDAFKYMTEEDMESLENHDDFREQQEKDNAAERSEYQSTKF